VNNRDRELIEQGRLVGMREYVHRARLALGADEARRIEAAIKGWDKDNLAAANAMVDNLAAEAMVALEAK
jgi:hypothetical protein